MKVYLKKLFVCLETISHPAGGWWRKDKETPDKEKSRRSRALSISSPDSVHVRGRGNKKGNHYRFTPAP